MKQIFILFIFIYSFAFSQNFRTGFDTRDASSSGGNSQGASYYSNVSSKLHNDESVFLIGYINMFVATRDKKYLDQFIIHTKRVQERRDDNITLLNFSELNGFPSHFFDDDGNAVCDILGIDQINVFSKGWSFVEEIGTVAVPNCQYNSQNPVQSGEITYPMALFVWYMQNDPAFIALQNEPLPLEATTVPVSSGCGMTSLQTYADFAYLDQNKNLLL